MFKEIENKMTGIDIELEEDKFYYVRYYHKPLFCLNRLKSCHGYLELINIDNEYLSFNREGQGDVYINFDKVVTIVEVKSKGKRILQLKKVKKK